MMMKLSRGLGADLVARDTAALLRFIDTLAQARRDRVGALGYCMGGRLALTAIGAFPERIQAAASLFGGKLITDHADSPHLKADRIPGELYFGFAEDDDYVPR